MKLTLIRHGLTEGNIRRLYYGAMDLPLLPDGIEALHALRDGGGYPDGLQGEQIPIEAQVVGLADVYERLVSRPVDGHARTHSEVVQMLCTGVCGAFNPLLLDCLQEMEAELARAMQDTPEET